MKKQDLKSGCPLNFGLELFGDKWTLLIIRDLMFFDKKYYTEFLDSREGISTNILASRLIMLEREKFITKTKDPSHKQKINYRLTKKGIDLLPMIIEVGLWSEKYAGNLLHEKKDQILGEVKRNKLKGIRKITNRLASQHLTTRHLRPL